MRQRNFFVSEPEFTKFFYAETGESSSWSLNIAIFDISIRCRDTGDQTLV